CTTLPQALFAVAAEEIHLRPLLVVPGRQLGVHFVGVTDDSQYVRLLTNRYANRVAPNVLCRDDSAFTPDIFQRIFHLPLHATIPSSCTGYRIARPETPQT